METCPAVTLLDLAAYIRKRGGFCAIAGTLPESEDRFVAASAVALSRASIGLRFRALAEEWTMERIAHEVLTHEQDSRADPR